MWWVIGSGPGAMSSDALIPSPFEEPFLGVPAFRLTDGADPTAALTAQTGPLFAFAKCPADDSAQIARLTALGFRRIQTQVMLAAPTGGDAGGEAGAFADTLTLTEAQIATHAAGFTNARLCADPALPDGAGTALMRAWIANTATGYRKVLSAGPNFVSYKQDGAALIIDLLSVIESGQGHARRLLNGLRAHARALGADRIDVVTEAENIPALNAYIGAGFRPVSAFAVMHLWRET